MKAPFTSFNYTVEVITPIHIGAAKENDYALGQDYYYDNGTYYFLNKRQLFKNFSNQQVVAYSNALAQNNVPQAERIIKEAANLNPKIIYHESYCPFPKQETIKKHISDGMGNLLIPGSSLKGALSGIIGKFLMQKNHQAAFNSRALFGDINNNLMRYLQVGDITFIEKGEITPIKTFSGDIVGEYKKNYDGIGQWKHRKNGGHNEKFNDVGFVSHIEMLIEGAKSTLRLNWADQLFSFVPVPMKHSNAQFFKEYAENYWLNIAKAHTNEYLKQEIGFFEKFTNSDFSEGVSLLENLLQQNNEPNSTLIRIGYGGGFHSITGNWQYGDHVFSMPQAEERRQKINAIKYKTRKVAFYDVEDETILQFPGFLKISIES
jgi:CRISPR/Cas system CSM-associated protein Csm5 (group 7 of RAMP superfamily)